MSQQNDNVFSVRRPRETLGAVSHNVSAIPMPASAMKRSTSTNNLQQQAPHTTHHVRTVSGSRMSLAANRPAQPNFHRSSSGDNLAQMGFSTVQRPSTANFLNTNPTTGGRKSYAPFASTPAKPIQLQESTQRRSSVYSQRPSAGLGPASHQSFFTTAPPPKGDVTDPRRLKDASTRAQMGHELLEFLSQRNFEMEMKYSLSPKCMSMPTQKDFEHMFQFLYNCIDPSYRFQRGMQVEIPELYKLLRYPFAKNISKSQLSAVGGSNWHIFLGLLHWIMQLAKMMENYATGAYDEACIESGYDVGADRITFQFLSDAYKEWLSIEEDDDDDQEAKRRIEPHVQAMAAKFEQANESNLEQVQMLEAEAKALQDQIDELAKSAPKLAKLDETIKVLEEDRVKFEKYNQDMERKIEKYLGRAQLLQEGIDKCEQELREAEDERDELQKKVHEQGLSVQQIDQMNAERERLQKTAETAAARLEESKERMSKREAETGTKLDELESAVQRYNSLGYQIGIIPSTAHNAHGHEYELQLVVNAGPNFTASQLGSSSQQMLETDRLLYDAQKGYQPFHLLQKDLKESKAHLQELRKEITERRNAALEEDMAKVDMLDKTKEALDDKAAEMSTLEHRLRAAQEEFDKTKELTSTQNLQSDAQIEKMEKQLGKTRQDLSESVQLMEQKEMNTNLEYEQLTLRSAALREELHTELERMLNDIIKFKIHIQTSLEGYEDFVAGEVERECEEQEAGSSSSAPAGPVGAGLDDELRDDEMEQ